MGDGMTNRLAIIAIAALGGIGCDGGTLGQACTDDTDCDRGQFCSPVSSTCENVIGRMDGGGADLDAARPDAGDLDAGDVDAGGFDAAGGLDGGGTDAATPIDAGPPVCGDGVLVPPEQCDDGNTATGDGCDDACVREVSASCGDGTVDRPAEECDDGNTTASDGCGPTCLVEAASGCGDGTLELAAGEECDDGNTTAGDGCGPTCQLEVVGAACGNGSVDGREVCDDGNLANGDGCNPTCNLRGETSLFVGMRGTATSVDGAGTAARIRGGGTLAADARYLWYAQGAGPMGTPPAELRRIEISTADVTTIGPLMGAGGIATDGTSTVWVAGGTHIQSYSTSPPHAMVVIHSGVAATNAATFRDGAPGTASFGDVRGLTWYGGFLWIVDTAAAVIRQMDPATGDVTTVAGMPYALGATDGTGSAARFSSPRYIVSDGSGMLYVSDTQGESIRALNAATGRVTTFAGVNGMAGHVDGIGTAARIHRPRGITVDGSSLYFCEADAHTIRQGVLATQSVTTLAGMADTTMGSMGGYTEGTGLAAEFAGPFSVAFHAPSGSLFVVDSGNSVIRRIR